MKKIQSVEEKPKTELPLESFKNTELEIPGHDSIHGFLF